MPGRHRPTSGIPSGTVVFALGVKLNAPVDAADSGDWPRAIVAAHSISNEAGVVVASGRTHSSRLDGPSSWSFNRCHILDHVRSRARSRPHRIATRSPAVDDTTIDRSSSAVVSAAPNASRAVRGGVVARPSSLTQIRTCSPVCAVRSAWAVPLQVVPLANHCTRPRDGAPRGVPRGVPRGRLIGSSARASTW